MRRAFTTALVTATVLALTGGSVTAAQAAPTPAEAVPAMTAAQQALALVTVGSAADPQIVAAPEPIEPDPSESAAPVITYETQVLYPGGRFKTGWQTTGQGSILYSETPAVDVNPGSPSGGNFISRKTGGTFPPTSPNGACTPPMEGAVSYTWPGGPGDTQWCNIGDSFALKCITAKQGSGAFANYAYGAPWISYEKRWQQREVIQQRIVVDGVPGGWTTISDRIVDQGPTEDTRVDWLGCLFYSAPYSVFTDCVTETGPMEIRGPFGRGLPARNGYLSDEIIPETRETTKFVKTDGGAIWKARSPIGQNFNGGRLNGYGQNNRSIALVENCAGWAASIPQNKSSELAGWGNYEITQDTLLTTCEVIIYPGFNQKNFQGCGPERPVTDVSYQIQRCNSNNPTGAPLSRSARTPDYVTNFDPASPDMNCIRTTCTWDNVRTAETGLPAETTGENARGTSLVWSSQAPDTLLRPGRTDGNIYVAGNGRDIHIQAPNVTLGFASPVAQRTGNRWTIWEVRPQSTPWNEDLLLGPNAARQPFTSRANGEDGVLSFGGEKPLYVDGDPIPDFNPNGRPAFVKDGQQPIVNVDRNGVHRWVRELVMNFYRPSWDEYPTWRTRGHFVEAVNVRLGISGLTSTSGRSAPAVSGRGTNGYVIAEACSTRWTNFSVVNERPTAN